VRWSGLAVAVLPCLILVRCTGKSSLVVRFVDSHFVERCVRPVLLSFMHGAGRARSYYPTIDNTFNKKLRIKGQDFSLDIHDTAGQVRRALGDR
jgi:Ras family protein